MQKSNLILSFPWNTTELSSKFAHDNIHLECHEQQKDTKLKETFSTPTANIVMVVVDNVDVQIKNNDLLVIPKSSIKSFYYEMTLWSC